MIDDPAKVMELMEKMESNLPIPASPRKPLIQTLREKGSKISPQQVFFIRSVMDLGDEGGIGCDLGTIGDDKNKEVLVCSLTHLSISPRHRLAKEIHAYQRQRKMKLAQQEHV